MRKKTKITTSNKILKEITYCNNVDECQITINETKLENILLKHKESLKAGSDWKTPLGLIISIVTVFLTAEFNKDFLGFKHNTWQAFFILLIIFSIFWLISSLIKKYKNRNKGIPFLIKHIKAENDPND